MAAGMRLVALLKSKNVYLLYWLPFVVAAIAGVYFWMGVKPLPCEGEGVLSLSFLAGLFEGTGGKMAGLLLLLLLAFFVFWVANKYQFLGQQTALPALIYSLLAAGTVCHYGISGYLWAAVCVTGALGRLQAAIADSNRNAPLSDFGGLIAAAVLLCPKLVMLLPWAVVSMSFSGRGMFKDFMAFLVGVAAVVLLTGAYYFYNGELAGALLLFMDNLKSGVDFWEVMSGQAGVFVLLAALLLVALGGMWPKSSSMVISQRRGMYSVMSMLLFVGSSLFFIPFESQEVLLVVFLPLAYVLSRYFIVLRRQWVGCVFFLLLLASGILLVF